MLYTGKASNGRTTHVRIGETQMQTESKTKPKLAIMRLIGDAVNSPETLNGIPTKVEAIQLDKRGINLIMRTVTWALHEGVDISIRIRDNY